jgi:hypothetical protein
MTEAPEFRQHTVNNHESLLSKLFRNDAGSENLLNRALFSALDEFDSIRLPGSKIVDSVWRNAMLACNPRSLILPQNPDVCICPFK